jgi:serine/threonine-protein kinase
MLMTELAASLFDARFHREIRLLAGLSHPNILPVLDSGQFDDAVFYVMPYVAGESLRHRIDKGGPLTLTDAMSLARDVASALDYAHSRNVVHRDVKPENILYDGPRAILADFGIARAILASSDSISSSGLVVGTAAYMSPEQALEGRVVDGRTDLYSLGCVLFEALTGEAPFSGPTAHALIARHITQPPSPIRTVRPEIPAHVERAIHSAMAKEPAQRPENGAAFVAMLEGERGRIEE